MKQIHNLLVVMCTILFIACSNEDDNDLQNVEEGKGGEGVITMVVDAKEDIAPDYFCIHSFKEGESITVDWGDDWVEEFKTVVTDRSEFGNGNGYWTDYLKHSYAKCKSYTITIKGNIKGLTYLCKYRDIAPLTSLDASRCPALKYLDCPVNELTSLDVSKNTALEYLDCSDNNLTSLDVSKNTALENLYCSENNLTSLDVSKNTKLENLYCFSNELTSLDVSKNTALEGFGCSHNNLTSLDVSKNTALKDLSCSQNNLTSLDVSKNKELFALYLNHNKFSSSALNKIFTDLPKITNWGEISIYVNPGTETCDKSIAEEKGWRVN